MTEYTLPYPPGVHNISDRVYHSEAMREHAVSKHDLDLVNRSPAHYAAAADNPVRETPAMLFGRVFHACVLEPDTFEDLYVVAPKFDRRTKVGKADAAAWEAERNPDTVPVSAEDYVRVLRMRDTTYAHAGAAEILDGAKCEVAAIWEHPDHPGLLGRAKIDIDKGGLLGDLKTTTDARPSEFSKTIFRYRYYVQAAYYLHGMQVLGREASHFAFIAVEKEAPWEVGAYVLDAEDVERGAAEFRRDLKRYAWCKTNDCWPGYGQTLTSIGIPKYGRRQLEEGLE